MRLLGVSCLYFLEMLIIDLILFRVFDLLSILLELVSVIRCLPLCSTVPIIYGTLYKVLEFNLDILLESELFMDLISPANRFRDAFITMRCPQVMNATIA